MNEIDVVVDVRQSPDTAELIVSKQKVAFSGDARLVGSPVESRVGLTTRKAVLSVFDEPQIVIHRRAEPIFDTLPEADRFAIIKALAPLRSIERHQWPAAGAHPLEGIPHTFVVRVGEDLGIVITQSEDKKVEVVDIVRESILEQVVTPGEDSKQ